MRLVAFLKEKCGDEFSGRKLKQAIESNQCRINGRIENFGSKTVKVNDRIEFLSKRKVSRKEKIIYEDEDIFCIDKPAGITSEKLAEKYSLELIHRLDRDTTGVFILAKSKSFLQQMIQLFRDRKISKTYLALVDGVPRKDSGKIENKLDRISSSGKIQWGESPDGQSAITEWEVEKRGRSAALVRCNPITGRTHQIRVHLLGLGHPVLGDSQYCQRFRCPALVTRPLLHALELQFTHPVTGKQISFHADLPDDFVQVMQEVLD